MKVEPSQVHLEGDEDFAKNAKIEADYNSESFKSETNNSIFFVPEYNFTIRSLLGGLLFGSLLCFSNMYFGLQTGWVTMGSLQSSLLGFGLMKILLRRSSFGPTENVFLQTVAVATATMPLAGGFVGIIPALKMMSPMEGGPLELDWWQMLLFAGGLAFFGVFFAVPLRRQTILREKLVFPSGTATAELIKILHNTKGREEQYWSEDNSVDDEALSVRNAEKDSHNAPNNPLFIEQDVAQSDLKSSSEAIISLTKPKTTLSDETPLIGSETAQKKQFIVLGVTFTLSGLYILTSYFFPVLKNIPIFTYFGLPVFTEFMWVITPSFSYVGQGMIMGQRTCISMFLGAVIGWGILAPMAKYFYWAPGRVGSYTDGATGWILWLSLAIMLAESVSSLVILTGVYVYEYFKGYYVDEELDPAPPNEQVPSYWWMIGLLVSSVLAVVFTWLVFRPRIPFYQPIVGLLFSLLVSILAVRALGETDLNPVSGVGKLSQVAFALIAPGNIASNIIAGAIAEAGAQQAGDMMQDLKTGHLLKASPKAQFFGQMIGSFVSVFVAVGAYELYSNAYAIPGPEFPVPTAPVWLNMARFVNGEPLPPNVLYFGIVFALWAASVPIMDKFYPPSRDYLLSAMAFGIAFYVTPNWTLPRVFGSLLEYLWRRKYPASHSKYMFIVASGFVLGEGVLSIFTALLKNPGGVHPISCGGCVPSLCGC